AERAGVLMIELEEPSRRTTLATGAHEGALRRVTLHDLAPHRPRDGSRVALYRCWRRCRPRPIGLSLLGAFELVDEQIESALEDDREVSAGIHVPQELPRMIQLFPERRGDGQLHVIPSLAERLYPTRRSSRRLEPQGLRDRLLRELRDRVGHRR